MSTPLRTHNFTVDEYHRMAEAGVFREDDRIELIDGQVVEMTPIGVAHAGCVNRLTELFSRLAGTTATLSATYGRILRRFRNRIRNRDYVITIHAEEEMSATAIASSTWSTGS